MLKKVSLATAMFLLMSFGPSIIAVPPPERCPNIDRAIKALEAAEHDMQVANHDFCGHKAEAMEAARHAIEQLRKAKECDKCR
jgi:hypothetical protein